jgi:tRNA-2-methylthio-N6-dimethylallyladenosine synthase
MVIINTCAIREKAEQKVWTELENLNVLKKKKIKENEKFFIGVVGCMAERLKIQLVEKKKYVDLIAGPDSYRDLPNLVNYLTQDINKNYSNLAINTHLSIDETYADIVPLRAKGPTVMVSIMRGCSNMCSFCIVPFVRGVERS